MALPGWSSKDPKYLCPCVRAKYNKLVSKLAFKITLIETGRDLARQRYYVKVGASKTMASKHLLTPDDDGGGHCRAFDVCPTEYLPLKGWNPNGPLWKKLGAAGESLGLEWGGSWGWDNPHFEKENCSCMWDKTE